MKKFGNFLRQPRFFLSLIVFPLLLSFAGCPGPPTRTCQRDINLTLAARKCAVVEPPCDGFGNWQPGDTLLITQSSSGNSPLSKLNPLNLYTSEIYSGDTLMKRVCQHPLHGELIPNGRAFFQYTFQDSYGEGTYNISVNNLNTFTASIGGPLIEPVVFDYLESGDSVKFNTQVKFGDPPYFYGWTANGLTIPSQPDGTVQHLPTRNTEYRVRVFSFNEAQAIAGAVVFVLGATGDHEAAFTISPQTIQTGQMVTLNPSNSTGNITRWEWDFDWHGDIVEPFEQTINGSIGTTMTSWSGPGKKYIRLRVTTATGNFHEIFQRITVN
jgi:hypothetical protein